jgi:hypothetical protein
MYRVNNRLFLALSEHIAIIASGTQGNRFKESDISPELRDRCRMMKTIPYALRFAGRFVTLLRDNNLAFGRALPELVRLTREFRADWVFCPCGVDPNALERGVRFAEACGLPLAVYLVDDFLAGALLSGNNVHLSVAREQVPEWLGRAQRIFVISEGLQQLVQKRYGLDSFVLPLPYDLLPAPSVTGQDSEQIIFVGNLSHFYVDGLKETAEVIDDLNRSLGKSLTLRFTLPNPGQVKKMIGDFACIRCRSCRDDRELRQEIAASLFCFAPYSFDAKFKDMVATSFPSKMLDYLASGRLVVTYAPAYASSVTYFRRYQLGVILDSHDKSRLRETILQQLQERNDFSGNYREVVTKNHAPFLLADRILSLLAEC